MPVIKPGDFDDDRVKALLTRHLECMHANSPPGHVFALDWSGLQTPEISFYALCGYEKSPFNQFLHLDFEAQPTDKRRPLTEEQIRAAHVGEVKPWMAESTRTSTSTRSPLTVLRSTEC